VYSEHSIRLPKTDALWNVIDPPQLHEGVHSIEARISPYKIARPSRIQESNRMHGEVQTCATEVAGKRGHYRLLETLRRN
jgi:hypothetical protein